MYITAYMNLNHSFNNKYVLSLGTGNFQYEYIRILKKIGFKIISCDINRKAPAKKLCDLFFNISIYDIKRLVALTKKLLKNYEIEKCFAFTTSLPTYYCSKINEIIGVSDVPASSVLTLLDKFEARKFLHSLNLSSIKFLKTTSLTIAIKFIQDNKISFVKPNLGGMGSSWVIKIEDRNKLVKFFDRVRKSSLDNSVFIENFVEGTEYKFSGILNNNELRFVSFEKTVFHPKIGIVCGHAIGPNRNLSSQHYNSICKAVKLVFKTLKIDNISFGIDVIVTDKCFELIDFEFITVDTHKTIKHCSSYDLLENEIAVRLGKKAEKFAGFEKACCVQKIVFPSSGTKRNWKDKIKKLLQNNQHILEYNMEDYPQGVVNTEYGKYIFQGYFVVGSKFQEEAIERSEEIYRKLINLI